MKPIVSTKGKSTQFRYELPCRVYDTKIYPIKAPNGSTILLYGQTGGVSILWRGGRPLKQKTSGPAKPSKPRAKVNGASEPIELSSDSDSSPKKSAPPPLPEAEFEEEEEELDDDQPCPSIIQHVQLPLRTDVLHIAVPPIAPASELAPNSSRPPIFTNKLVFAVACADFTVRVITLPLSPPSEAAKERTSKGKSRYGEEVTAIPMHAGHQDIPRGVTMTWTSRSEPRHEKSRDDEMDVDTAEGDVAPSDNQASRQNNDAVDSAIEANTSDFDLLVASHTSELGGLLKLWRFNLTDTSVQMTTPVSPSHTLTLQKPATKVAFNTAQYPKARHTQLLIADRSGTVRIFDPAAARKVRTDNRPSKAGAFLASFKTGFEYAKSNAPPALAARKPVIDAAWVSDGHHIIALLADGEWGVWDTDRSGPNPPIDPSAFSLRGFVGTSDSERTNSGPSSPKSRSGRSSLVPMTPNTRRKKEDTLFHGTSSSSTTSAIPAHGGISVASLTATHSDQAEDSVVIWYGPEVHRIADLAKFWKRAASAANGNSLPGSSLSHIQNVSVLNESITSIAQFPTTAQEARMAIPRDILVSGEHRLVILANNPPSTERNLMSMFTNERVEEEETRKTDKALLARGELDLGGMDRLLDDMGGSGSNSLVIGNPRKVLFASSTA
ncbi:hypothetical protein DM02DRAFT_638344 [Periconia macrospinosa]|uniref:WD40 repeat-like protein n=1 Tax=Periconia macrospinosa TaxID=97972 RepID=A0A2V1E9C3_9PLEO|nr:hypothetical protein DM02DRAFT_638344 [Periconia macrospinosa]